MVQRKDRHESCDVLRDRYNAPPVAALIIILLAISPAAAKAQTYFIQNGGGNLGNSGYDPSSGIASVLSGRQSVISAGRQNAQSAQSAYADASGGSLTGLAGAISSGTNAETGSAESNTATVAPSTRAQDDYGFGLLSPSKPDPSLSIKDQSALDRQAASDADTKERIQEFLRNKKDSARQNISKGTESSPTAPAFSMVKGRATALDAITLKVDGHIAVLSGLSAPGVGVMCYNGDFPWSCGDKGREVLSRIVQGVTVLCKIRVSDTRAACQTEDGENINRMVAERGYAVSTDQTTSAEVSMARSDHRGIFQ